MEAAQPPAEPAPPSADTRPIAELPVAVAAGARFEGLLSFRGGSCVDGEFRGQIAAKGRLVLGEASHVRGIVEADEVVIAGVLEGEVRARGRLELRETARLIGDFNLVLSYTIKQNSDVPVGTDKTDTLSAVSIEYAF